MNTQAPPIRISSSQKLKPLTSKRILQALSHPVFALDADGVIIYANAAAEAAFNGWVVGLSLRDLLPGLTLPNVTNLVPTSIRLSSKDDETYDVTVAPIDDGHIVVDLRRSRKSLPEVIATELDELTGLATRAMLMSHLNAALAHDVGSSSFAVHCIDLDRFKMVNDTLGHAIGDLLLKKVAERLTAASRKGDIVARLGGDEFVLLQQDVKESSDAERLAARIVDLVGRTYVLAGHTINIGASVGVALSNEAEQARDVLRNADLALYEAKRAGRNRYRCFASSMSEALQERRDMETDLRRALALKQFDLSYQPFVDLNTDKVVGFEALLRWNHPTKGLVPPLQFIPLAEENGLIVRIGEWVLLKACMEAVTWPSDMIVAVNVSPLQFKADNLLETVSSALARSRLPAHRLELEITESVLLDDTDNVLLTLNALRELGVKISMDDFGTGYSSLAYLQKFPFNKIKIDRSFVAGGNADSEAILRAVATLGTSLGMAITAEGVETPDSLSALQRTLHSRAGLLHRSTHES